MNDGSNFSIIWNNRDIVNLLIENFKLHKCLWKVKDKNYKNRILKHQAYEKLKTVLAPYIPDITIDIIKRKIDGLRGQYRRELKSLVNSKKSGAGREDVYTPKLWCFNSLDFLREGDVMVTPQSTITPVSSLEKVTT